jgi:biopolymer transport protein TolR
VSNFSDTPRKREEKFMAMSTAAGGTSAPQMNVTPLIDVLLVLIIIFMVIVAQSKEKGFKADIPQPPTMPDSPREVRAIVIQLGEPKSGEKPVLKINQQAATWADLKLQLANIFKQRAEKIGFVQGDDAVDFEYVADVIDAALEAGVERVGLLPKEMASSR